MLNFWLGQVTEAINYLLAQIDQMDDTSNSFGDFFVRHHQFIFTIAFAGFTAYQILFCKIPFDMANPKRRSRYGPLWSTSLVICVVSGALVLLFNLTLAVYIGFFFLDNLRANLEFGMGTAVKFHFKYYKGPMNNQPAKISRHTSKLQQIQFRFKCCGDWRGWETYKHLRTFESAP